MTLRTALLLLIGLSYCGCATSRSAEAEAQARLKLDKGTLALRTETQRTEQGPETVTTVIDEFAPVSAGIDSPVRGPAPTLDPATVGHEAAGVRNAGMGLAHAPPVLLRRTTVVDVRGPVVSEATASTQRATETHATAQVEAEAKSASSFKPSGLLALWPYLLAAGVAALAWWRKDLLLGAAKGLLGKLIP